MIDLILLCFFLGVAYGAFRCGAKFKTLAAMFDGAKATVNGWMK